MSCMEHAGTYMKYVILLIKWLCFPFDAARILINVVTIANVHYIIHYRGHSPITDP